MRLGSTWRDPAGTRGSRDREALGWEDGAALLAGASPLAFAAFTFRHSEEPPAGQLVEHLLAKARQVIGRSEHATPEQLVDLLLREERAPESHRLERHRILALGVSPGAWRRYIARPYTSIATELECLVSDAWRVIQQHDEQAA
jgi:hypothetical protein